MAEIGSIGRLEQFVLTAILSLHENAYGVTIHAKVAELAKPRKISLGVIYVTLDALEDKGFIASWLSDPTPQRGWRAKRFYRVEAIAEQALQESTATATRISEAIAQTLGKNWARKWEKEWNEEIDSWDPLPPGPSNS